MQKGEGPDPVHHIPIEEADQEWLESMNCAGWPALKPGHFQRHFWDSGENVRELCLLHTPPPTEPPTLALAA